MKLFRKHITFYDNERINFKKPYIIQGKGGQWFTFQTIPLIDEYSLFFHEEWDEIEEYL